MKKTIFGVFTIGIGLMGAVGCNRGTPGGTGATAQAPSGEAASPAPTVANKPVIGEAENTFTLSMPLQSIALEQGEEKAVVVGISRGRNFGHEVAITLAGLPTGVTLKTENPVIKRSDTEATLVLEVADDASLGDFTAKVTGHSAAGGVDATNELKITVAQK